MTAYTLYQKGWEITQTRKTVPVRTGLKTTACIILQVGKESVTDGKAEINVSSRPFQSWDRNNQYLQTHAHRFFFTAMHHFTYTVRCLVCGMTDLY